MLTCYLHVSVSSTVLTLPQLTISKRAICQMVNIIVKQTHNNSTFHLNRCKADRTPLHESHSSSIKRPPTTKLHLEYL